MTLRKSQGVGTLTVQLSCNYVHGFKRPSILIFIHILAVFQRHVITNRAMTRLVFLVEHGPKVWDCVLCLCIVAKIIKHY